MSLPRKKDSKSRKSSPAGKGSKPSGQTQGVNDGFCSITGQQEEYAREPWRGEEWKTAEKRLDELIKNKWLVTKSTWLGAFKEVYEKIVWAKIVSKKEPGFSEQELLRIGAISVLRMLEKDLGFFDDLSRFAKSAFRENFQTNEERLLITAFELRETDCTNPSREAVKKAVLASGVRIDERDWSGYFKRCGLDFLEKSKPGRRPIKRGSRGKSRKI